MSFLLVVFVFVSSKGGKGVIVVVVALSIKSIDDR